MPYSNNGKRLWSSQQTLQGKIDELDAMVEKFDVFQGDRRQTRGRRELMQRPGNFTSVIEVEQHEQVCSYAV